MATTYFLGTILNSYSWGPINSVGGTYSALEANDEIYATCTMNNNNSSFKVALIRVSISGSIDESNTIPVQVGPNLDGSGGVSGTMKKGYPFYCYISYQEPTNYIFINIPQEIRSSVYISVDFEALDASGARDASYTVKTGNVYDGTRKYAISSSSYCDASGTYSAINAGTYTCYMTAENSNAKYTDCYYFNVNNIAVPQQTVEWTISKADQNWTAASMMLDAGGRQQIAITGSYYGTLSYSGYDRDVATLDTSYTPAYVRGESAGSTFVTITASGGTNYNAREQTITIVVSGSISNCRIRVNGEWVTATPYIYSGGWKKATAYIYSGGWKKV